MTEAASETWRTFAQTFLGISARIERVKTYHLNSGPLKDDITKISDQYFKSIRLLFGHDDLSEEAGVFDEAFSKFLQLTHGRNAIASYKKQSKRIRKAIPAITKKMALHSDEGKTVDGPTAEEQKLIRTIHELVPPAALSYEQAIIDLADPSRRSFRGPATELREALREVLDKLAPDDEVIKSPGFQLEEGRPTPTTKQKVRFILRARGMSKSQREAPENTANTIDELIAGLTRSVQNLSSVAAHIATERTNVRRVKRYIDAILHDILEL